MTPLPILIELQAVHDNLRTIQRDLTAYPPDLAALDEERKALARKLAETGTALTAARGQRDGLTNNLAAAQKLEDLAKAALKETKQKVQFTAAIRELDERQRQKAAVARPLKETEARIATLEQANTELVARQTVVQTQFDELRAIFLSEHQNQVEAQDLLLARKAELQAQMEPAFLTRFERLLQQRQGKAVVPLEQGACSGCRTRLRTPLLAQLRAELTVPCESCQRFVYDPARQS